MSISPKWRRILIAAHDGVCFYCGTANATHIDHIVPRVCGGTDDVSNLIAACLPCNLRKHRHRLPPKAERRALDAAHMAIGRMIEISHGMPRGSFDMSQGIPPRPRRRENLDQRVRVTMTAEMVAQIDAWGRRQGIAGRSEAIRAIIEDVFSSA